MCLWVKKGLDELAKVSDIVTKLFFPAELSKLGKLDTAKALCYVV